MSYNDCMKLNEILREYARSGVYIDPKAQMTVTIDTVASLS